MHIPKEEGKLNKRILLISPFPPNIGGISMSSQRLYDYLLENGYDVNKYDIRFTSKKLNRYGLLKIIRPVIVPFYLLFKKRYDIVHFNVSGSLIKFYISIWRKVFSKRTQFICSIHGDVADLLIKNLGKRCLFGFDKVICVKEGDKEILENYFKKCIVEIPAFIPPVITDNFEDLIPQGIRKFIDNEQLPLILWNGFLITDENHFDLYGLGMTVKAFLKLAEKGINSKLLILLLGEIKGSKSEKLFNEIRQIINCSDLKRRILIHQVANTPLWPILKQTAVFIRPTSTDGDALSVREALYFNVPVVASDSVHRPSGTLVFKLNDQTDFIQKICMALTMKVMTNSQINYAGKIVEQYEAV